LLAIEGVDFPCSLLPLLPEGLQLLLSSRGGTAAAARRMRCRMALRAAGGLSQWRERARVAGTMARVVGSRVTST